MNLSRSAILKFQYLRLMLALFALVFFIWSFIKKIEIFAAWIWIPFIGFLLSEIFFFLYMEKIRYERLIWAELILDTFLVSLVIFGSGGRESPFVYLYPLLIFIGTLHLGKKGANILTLLILGNYLLFWLWPPLLRLEQKRLIQFFTSLGVMGVSGILALRFAEEIAQREYLAEETLANLYKIEELYSHIMRSMASGLIITDLEGIITSSNYRAREILAISPLEGRKITEIFPFLDLGDTKHRGEGEIYIKNEKRHLGYNLFRLKDENGRSFGYGFIFQDITRIKKQEEKLRQAEHLAAVGTMAAGLVHEIKNPLASISGAIQLLKEEMVGHPQAKQLLEILERESLRLDDLVTNFLFFAKPSKGEIREVNLYHICQETLEELACNPDLSLPEIKISIPDNIFLRVDPKRFKQILINLCINAFQAVKRRDSPIVELNFYMEEENGIFTIKDNGVGIPCEILSHVFEPFFTTKSEGTGLGLSVVYSLIKAFGGKIEIESEPNRGTTVKILFPHSIISTK